MIDEIESAAIDFSENFRRELKMLREDFVEKILRDELIRGCWGTAAKENFLALSQNEQSKILYALKRQELCDGRRLFFRLALQILFPVGNVYFYEGKFLLCLPEEISDAALKKIELIKILFMDAGNSELEIYFGRRFGVFGTPQTMRLDEMILY